MVEIMYMGDIRLRILDEGTQLSSCLNGIEYSAGRFDRGYSVRLSVKVNGRDKIFIPEGFSITRMMNSERYNLMAPLLKQATYFQHVLFRSAVEEKKLVNVKYAHPPSSFTEPYDFRVLFEISLTTQRTAS